MHSIMACSLATRMVYGQGLAFVDQLKSPEQLSDVAFKYVGAEQRVAAIAEKVAALDGISADDAATVRAALHKAGVLAMLETK
jgi:HD-like signal output (HDOD) protein